MTARTCARCNWHPADDETLTEHAEAADHPLCISCEHSLVSDRPRVCRDCEDRTSALLADVMEMWAELPDLLDNHADEQLPGGNVLVLLGPGSTGAQGADDPEVRKLIDDNRRNDIPSVAWTLITWADDWARISGDADDDHGDVVGGTAFPVERAYRYLRDRGSWAAAHHWAWAEYAADIAHLHGALLRATGRHRRPTRLGLDCFLCRGPLEYRIVRDGDAPPTRPRWWVSKNVAGPVDVAEWQRRHLSTAGLEEDHATCRDCGSTYETAQLLLAQRSAVEDAQWREDDDGTWGTVTAVAGYVHRSQWTLRTWHRQGVVRGRERAGFLYLNLGDVQDELRRLVEAQWVQDEDGTRWGTVAVVADVVRRPRWTLRSWLRSGLVRSRRVPGEELFLHLADVERESALRPSRRRTA